MSFSSVKRVLPVFFVVALSMPALGQLGPWPGWVLTDPIPDGVYKTHPSLQAISTRWVIFTRTTQGVLHGSTLQIFWHPDHGEIALRRLNTVAPTKLDLGAFSTGLSYLLGVRSVKNTDGSPRGLLLLGIHQNNHSRVLFLPLTDTTDVNALSVQQLVSDSADGERYLVGDICKGGNLYVFDAKTTEVRKFQDSNADGLPDSPAPVTPVQLKSPRLRGRLLSFYDAPNNEVGLQFSGELVSTYYVVKPVSGQLKIYDRDIEVDKPRIPHIRGAAIAGLKKLRLKYRQFSAIRVRAGVSGAEQAISADSRITDDSGTIDVTLTRPLVVGESVVVEDISDPQSKREYTAVPQIIDVFPGAPETCLSSAQLLIFGGNFEAATTLVQISIDDGSLGACNYTVVDSENIAVTAPNLSQLPGTPMGVLLQIRISDSRFSNFWIDKTVYVIR